MSGLVKRVVECVPNFSEGRRPEVLERILNEIRSVPGVALLDHEMDAAHNRAVVTLAGDPEACSEACFRAIQKAAEVIDLTQHQGEHPRMGATDVCPFIPISGISDAECVLISRALAKRVADELKIPTYLYEQAAIRPDRTDLAVIRKGEFEGIREAVKTDPLRAPDFGPCELHPTAGATVIGVRFPLIAYNINLTTNNVEIAKKIAKAIRFRDGGFKFCKAMGFSIPEKNCAQVSMNMTNFNGTPLYRVYEAVKREAQRYGVGILESEIIGLTPQQALIDTAVWSLQLDSFKNEQILENRLSEKLTESGASSNSGRAGSLSGITAFLNELAAPTATPGGGSVAALSGAQGCALLAMVCGLTVGKKNDESVQAEIAQLYPEFKKCQQRFIELVSEDAQAFEAVMTAFKLPKNTEAEKEARTLAIEKATQGACETPLEMARLSARVMPWAMRMVKIGNKNSVSDSQVAVHCLETAFKSALLNVNINLDSMKDSTTLQHYVVQVRNEIAGLMG